jgi:hypothetical protein
LRESLSAHEMISRRGRRDLVLLASFRDQPLIAALSIRDRCVALMARLYRLYRFRGSWVISRAVLQPLGVALEARQLVSIHKIVPDFAPNPSFFNGHAE